MGDACAERLSKQLYLGLYLCTYPSSLSVSFHWDTRLIIRCCQLGPTDPIRIRYVLKSIRVRSSWWWNLYCDSSDAVIVVVFTRLDTESLEIPPISLISRLIPIENMWILREKRFMWNGRIIFKKLITDRILCSHNVAYGHILWWVRDSPYWLTIWRVGLLIEW